jgi:hypothetical protein
MQMSKPLRSENRGCKGDISSNKMKFPISNFFGEFNLRSQI